MILSVGSSHSSSSAHSAPTSGHLNKCVIVCSAPQEHSPSWLFSDIPHLTKLAWLLPHPVLNLFKVFQRDHGRFFPGGRVSHGCRGVSLPSVSFQSLRRSVSGLLVSLVERRKLFLDLSLGVGGSCRKSGCLMLCICLDLSTLLTSYTACEMKGAQRCWLQTPRDNSARLVQCYIHPFGVCRSMPHGTCILPSRITECQSRSSDCMRAGSPSRAHQLSE